MLQVSLCDAVLILVNNEHVHISNLTTFQAGVKTGDMLVSINGRKAGHCGMIRFPL